MPQTIHVNLYVARGHDVHATSLPRGDVYLLLAGQIGYALAPQVARGAMLGPDQPVILHLLDIAPAAQSLEGVKMELIDAALPLLAG